MPNPSYYSRRQFLKTASSAAMAATLASHRAFAAPASFTGRQPNILMVVADDQRYDTIAALGNKVIQTRASNFSISRTIPRKSTSGCRTPPRRRSYRACPTCSVARKRS